MQRERKKNNVIQDKQTTQIRKNKDNMCVMQYRFLFFLISQNQSNSRITHLFAIL